MKPKLVNIAYLQREQPFLLISQLSFLFALSSSSIELHKVFCIHTLIVAFTLLSILFTLLGMIPLSNFQPLVLSHT